VDELVLLHFTRPDKSLASVFNLSPDSVAARKVFNVKHHYETSHKSFADKFPVDSEFRKLKLLMKYKSAIQILGCFFSALTEQQKYAQASLHVSWTLAKHAAFYRC